MRTALTIVGWWGATVFLTDPLGAQNAPWCAMLNNQGATQCAYYTQQECLQALSGIGGQCIYSADGSRAQAAPGNQFFPGADSPAFPPVQLGPPPGLDGAPPAAPPPD